MAQVRTLKEADRRINDRGRSADDEFSAWPDSPSEMVARINDIWRSSSGGEWEFCCWVNNTPAGDLAGL